MAGKTDVGKLSVILSASSTEFERAIDHASKRLSTFASVASAPLGMAGKALSAPGSLLAQGFAPIEHAVRSIPFLGDKIGELATPSGFLANLKEQAKELVHTAHQAESVGLRFGQLVALQRAAGPAADSVVPALRHFTRELGAVALGSSDAARRFSQFGLDGEKLVKLGPAKALEEIAKRAKTLPGALEEGKLAFDMFGKKGQELGLMLERISGGLGKLEQKAIAQGLVPTGKQLDDLKRYLAAQKEIDALAQGMKVQAAVQVAEPAGNYAANLAKKPLSTIWKTFSPLGWAVQAIPGQGVFENPGVNRKNFREEAERDIRDMEAALGRATRQHFADLIAKLEATSATFHMAAGAAAEFMAKQQGATEAEAARIKVLTDTLRLQTSAKGFDEQALTGLEKYNATMNEARRALDAGMIGNRTFGSAQLNAIQALERAYPTNTPPPLQALVRGSQEDRSYGMELERDGKRHKWGGDLAADLKRIAELEAMALGVDQENGRKLDAIGRALGELGRKMEGEGMDAPGI